MRTSVCVMDMLDAIRYTRTDMRTCGCCIVKSILHKLPWDFLFNLIYFYWIRTICLFIPVEITPHERNKEQQQTKSEARGTPEEIDWQKFEHEPTHMAHDGMNTTRETERQS